MNIETIIIPFLKSEIDSHLYAMYTFGQMGKDQFIYGTKIPHLRTVKDHLTNYALRYANTYEKTIVNMNIEHDGGNAYILKMECKTKL